MLMFSILWLRFKLSLRSRSKRIAKMKALPVETRYELHFGGFSYNWKYLRCYPMNMGCVWRSIKYLFSESYRINQDSWSLDISTSLWILPRLRLLLDSKSGVPQWAFGETAGDYPTPEEFEVAKVKFREVMNDIIYAFEYTLLDSLRHRYEPPYTHPAYTERKDRGFAYFGKYFQSLWD